MSNSGRCPCSRRVHRDTAPHLHPRLVAPQSLPLQVSKAYRKLSILVHPDKNPGEEAREAFEALNEAHRALKDKDKLVCTLWSSRVLCSLGCLH